MPQAFAARLWVTTKLGARVIVARQELAPSDFSHRNLFVPKPKPADLSTSAERPIDGLRPTFAALPESAAQAWRVRLAWATPARRTVALNDLPDSGETATDASAATLPQAPAASVEAAEAIATPVQVETAAAAKPVETPADLASPAKPVDTAADVETTASSKADAAPVQGQSQPAATAEPSKAITQPAPQLSTADPDKPDAANADPTKRLPARTKAAEPVKRNGQVAVFISRKEKKIYIRHDRQPIFEMPVEIADIDQPLGTHVFTALEFTDHGAAMRWNAVSMPAEPPKVAPPPRGGQKKNGPKGQAQPATTEVKALPTAAEALDRIRMPQEAIDLVGELLMPGSSLVISDEGLGRETGRYTEFVVLQR
jgi:hypothetical protein